MWEEERRRVVGDDAKNRLYVACASLLVGQHLNISDSYYLLI
jgi:hypothetical protein